MKMPCLSIKQRLLSLIIMALFFGLTPTIHAEGLSGLKDSLNKGKINKNETNEVPAVQPNIVSEPAVSKAPAKINRITDANTGKTKFNFVDKKRSDGKAKPLKSKKDAAKEFNEELKKNYDKMLVTLKQARKKKKASPRIAAVRIGDDPENDASIPAKLPEDFLINVDTDELAVRKEISNLYDSFESTSLEDFNKACQALHIKYYQTRPDICYLIHLIKTDAQLKKDPNSALEDQTYRKLRWPTSFEPIPYPSYNPSIYEEYLKMGRGTEYGNDIIKFVNQKAKIRQSQIKKANDDLLVYIRNEINVLNKLKADYEAYVKELLSLTHIVPGYTSQYENNPDYLQRVMKYAIDDIKVHYQKISQRYLLIAIYLNSAGQWEESLNLTKDFKDYFEKSCPYKFTIKFAGKFDYDAAASSGNLGNLKILKGDLLIDKDNLKWGPKRIDQAALECMSRLSLQNITDQINNLEFHKKVMEFAETNVEDKEEIKEYKKESKVKEIWFEANEFSGISSSSHVFAANERVCIKCYYEPGYNQYYQPPIVITLTSTVSNRYKYVTVIGNRGYSPYAIFQPNEIEETPVPPPMPSPPPEPPAITAAVKLDNDDSLIFHRNLVNRTRDAQTESISILSGYKGYEDGLSLYNNKEFFRYRNVRASWKGADLPNKVVDVTKEFCFGGGEVIYADCRTATGYAVVANQADWFMLESHGNPRAAKGFLRFTNKEGQKIDVLPSELEGKYDEDIDVLILDACFCMNNFNKFKWKKVLPKGVIIGFTSEVLYPGQTEHLFNLFNNKLKPQMLPQAICDAFLDTNADIINENAANEDEQKLSTDSAYHQATCIIGDTFGSIVQTCNISPRGAKTYKYEKTYRKLQ